MINCFFSFKVAHFLKNIQPCLKNISLPQYLIILGGTKSSFEEQCGFFYVPFQLIKKLVTLRVSSQRDNVQITSVLAFISCYLQIQSTFICRQ